MFRHACHAVHYLQKLNLTAENRRITCSTRCNFKTRLTVTSCRFIAQYILSAILQYVALLKELPLYLLPLSLPRKGLVRVSRACWPTACAICKQTTICEQSSCTFQSTQPICGPPNPGIKKCSAQVVSSTLMGCVQKLIEITQQWRDLCWCLNAPGASPEQCPPIQWAGLHFQRIWEALVSQEDGGARLQTMHQKRAMHRAVWDAALQWAC